LCCECCCVANVVVLRMLLCCECCCVANVVVLRTLLQLRMLLQLQSVANVVAVAECCECCCSCRVLRMLLQLQSVANVVAVAECCECCCCSCRVLRMLLLQFNGCRVLQMLLVKHYLVALETDSVSAGRVDAWRQSAYGSSYTCRYPDCGRSFRTKESLQQHISDVSHCTCRECFGGFGRNRGGYVREYYSDWDSDSDSGSYYSSDDGEYQCRRCDKCFETREAMMQHVRDTRHYC
jgi:hypothetical protein